TRSEISNQIKTLRGSADIRVRKFRPIGDFEIRTRNFNNDDPDFLLTRGNFCCSKVAGRDIVVIPEAEINNLITREKLPHLRRKDAKVGSSVGCRLRPGVPRQYMQNPGAEF